MNTYIYDGRLGHTNLLKAIKYIENTDPAEGKLVVNHFMWQGDRYLRNKLQTILVDATEKQMNRSFIVKPLGPAELDSINLKDIAFDLDFPVTNTEECLLQLSGAGLDLERKFVEVVPTKEFIKNDLLKFLENNSKLILYMPFKEFGQILDFIEKETEYKNRDIQVINQKLDTNHLLFMLTKDM